MLVPGMEGGSSKKRGNSKEHEKSFGRHGYFHCLYNTVVPQIYFMSKINK